MNGRTPNTEPSPIVREGVETRRGALVANVGVTSMSRTHKLAWAAGFFDGEGYVNIQKRSHQKYIGHYLRIGINHVAPEPLIEMQKLFGGSITKSSKVRGNRKPRHRWVTSTKNAAEALKQMMPFFRNKNNVAEVALDFQATVSAANRGQMMSDEMLNYREWCKDEIQRLNSLD